MKRRYRKQCPICSKPNLLKLSNHLREQHYLEKEQRSEYLRKAPRELENPQIIYRGFEKKLLGIDPDTKLSRTQRKAIITFAKRNGFQDIIVTQLKSKQPCPSTIQQVMNKFHTMSHQ